MQQTFGREVASVLLKAGVVIGSILLLIVIFSVYYYESDDISDGYCNIAVIPVEGAILPFNGLADFDLITTPQTVEDFMLAAESDLAIQGVLAEINSPGGTPVASERIAERFRASDLPVIGLAGDIAASGGYMVAAATDHLIASPISDIGSIGVTMSYLEESQKNEDEGITYVQLTTGKYKDIGSPNRPITDEERELLLADLQVVHEHFVDLVADYRKLDREAVAALADGSTMPGIRAEEVGLVDSLGGREKARELFSFILEIEPEDVIFCEYDGGSSLFYY